MAVRISGVELTNYTSDLSLECNYDLETGVFESITLSQHAEKQILLSGKTWKLKFNVYFTDAAGNERGDSIAHSILFLKFLPFSNTNLKLHFTISLT